MSPCSIFIVIAIQITVYLLLIYFFFFNDTPTTEIYTLSLHDALPIFPASLASPCAFAFCAARIRPMDESSRRRKDRKSTRLNSSHGYISYAVFCLKKKKKIVKEIQINRKQIRIAIIRIRVNGGKKSCM